MQHYRIDVPDAVLEDLHARSDRTLWPPAVAGAGWNPGSATWTTWTG